MTERIRAVVVGAGQAGLAASRELTQAGVEHVVLERGRVAQTWRGRWDSFCLVAPNWTVQLPGGDYDGPDPDGFMARDDIVAFLERYARGFAAPVREGVDVRALEPDPGGGLLLDTSAGRILAEHVVVASGAYQRPHRPPAASALPDQLLQIDAEDYRNPGELPDGPVLVIGAGQTGCQIADELHAAGRSTFLSCGRAPWLPRRIGDRDLTWWAVESGFLDAPVDSLPAPAARLAANLLATGHGGGRDLHLRTLHADGVGLLGRFAGVDGRRARFAPDLAESVRWGDQKHNEFMGLVRKFADTRGLAAPAVAEPAPLDVEPVEAVDLRGFGAIIFAGGYRPDYASWIRIPDAFDELGFPLHRDGASTAVPGLHFVGVHFLRKRKSALLIGVGEDAAIVARGVAAATLTA
jgi:putative flavoprotein involved in K+ transport